MPDSWWVLLLGGLPGLVSGAFVAIRWWSERGDKRDVDVLSHQERMSRDMEAQRATLSKDASELFDRYRAETDRLQLRNAQLEKDRDRGWDLCRYWFRFAETLVHSTRNAQAVASGLANQAGIPPPVWPDLTMPSMEEPK